MRVVAPDPRSRIEAAVGDIREGTAYRPQPDGTSKAESYVARYLVVSVDGEVELDNCPQFGPADDQFPPNPCASCDEWSCNNVEGWAVMVRRSGPCVVWFYPNDRIVVFDGTAYDAALRLPGEEAASWTTLPAIDDRDRDRFDLWHDLDRIRDRSEELQIAVDAVLVAPARFAIDFELAESPPEAIVIGDKVAWFARSGERWLAYLPGIFGLPSWFASPIVDELAAALGLAW